MATYEIFQNFWVFLLQVDWVLLIEYVFLGIIIGITISVKLIRKTSPYRDIWSIYYYLGIIMFILMAVVSPQLLNILGTLATFIVALLTFKTVDEMRASRVAEFRPRVIVDFDIPYGTSIIELVVKNEGRSLAKNISFSIQPELIDSKDRNISSLKMFKDGISTLISGKEIRQIFDSGPSYLSEDKQYPLIFNVKIEYEDINGNKYEDEMELDLEIYKWLVFVPKRI